LQFLLNTMNDETEREIEQIYREISRLRKRIDELIDECTVEDFLLNGPGAIDPEEH